MEPVCAYACAGAAATRAARSGPTTDIDDVLITTPTSLAEFHTTRACSRRLGVGRRRFPRRSVTGMHRLANERVNVTVTQRVGTG
jgi:hypothetical protein